MMVIPVGKDEIGAHELKNAIEDAVVKALGHARDFENFPASTTNYLQCIRRLVERERILMDLVADKDPRMGKLDVMNVVNGLEEEIRNPEHALEIRNNTLARRVMDLENENRVLNRELRKAREERPL